LQSKKTVTSLRSLKMADSLPSGIAVDSVSIPIARQKSGPKAGQKSALSDDVKLKLAQHISSDLEIRHVLLIPGKRNKQHVITELLDHTNEYLTPMNITKATLNKWLVDCIAECLEWEVEFATEEKDGGSRKSGQDNLPDDAHKQAWVQLMREARALTAKDQTESAQVRKKSKFNLLTGKVITPSLPAPRPSIAGPAAPTDEEVCDVDAVISKDGCGQAMASALEATSARKAAGQAANNLNYKSPPQRPDLVAELMTSMRARQERDDGLFAGVRRSMAYDQLPAAEQRLARAQDAGEPEEIARATRALNRIRDEIDV
jgi:hypothetical protein